MAQPWLPARGPRRRSIAARRRTTGDNIQVFDVLQIDGRGFSHSRNERLGWLVELRFDLAPPAFAGE